MIKEIKKLYRKDKKLAIEAAKVLGYKIVAREFSFKEDVMRKVEDAFEATSHAVESLDDIVKANDDLDFPKIFKKMFILAKSNLNKLKNGLPNYYKGVLND